MDSKMCEQKITWDNTYIEEIDHILSNIVEDKNKIYASIKINESSNENIILYEFNGFIPLICEEFKSIFNLRKTGKHIVKYKSKFMLMVRNTRQVSLKDCIENEFLKPNGLPDYLKEEVKKMIAFRWIFCLKNNNEKCFNLVYDPITPPYIINDCEDGLNYKVKISQRLIDDWFGDTEKFHDLIRSMICDRDVSLIRMQIQKIIEKYDKNLISWANVIYNRLLLI